MNAFLRLPAERRRLLCEEGQQRLGLTPASIEKDFWVCWTLWELFGLPQWGEHLTFKGGTSLSKGWRLTPAGEEEDPDQQTLLFHYPSVFTDSVGYVRPVVKIELGARSETEPVENPIIKPYLAEAFPDLLGDSAFALKTVAAERTFWEKAMLLHEEGFRPADKPRRVRLSRHYYDLWCLIRKGIAAQATTDPELFNRVARHRQIFFKVRWVNYDTLRKGTLRLLPPPEQLSDWRRDYEAMRKEMFFDEPPSFDEVLAVIRQFEETFNLL